MGQLARDREGAATPLTPDVIREIAQAIVLVIGAISSFVAAVKSHRNHQTIVRVENALNGEKTKLLESLAELTEVLATIRGTPEDKAAAIAAALALARRKNAQP